MIVLQIHYGQSEHSVEEGSTVLSSLIYFQFWTNQNSFNIARSPVTVDAAEAMGLGFFIISATIVLGSRATAGNNIVAIMARVNTSHEKLWLQGMLYELV